MATSEGPASPDFLIQQGLLCLMQFQQLGNPEYLERAITLQKHVITLTTEGEFSRSVAFSSLAETFMIRFKHYGDPEDINKAVGYCTQAIQKTPNHLVAPMLGLLGSIHVYRFSAFHQLEDIERSLSFILRAICISPPNAEYLPGIYNELALALKCRFEQLKDTRDIDHAIMCQQQSLIGARLHREYPARLANLGLALRERFRYLDRKEDIDTSIRHLRRVTQLAPDSQIALKAHWRNNLAVALADRFDHYGELADIDECIQILNDTLLLGLGGYLDKGNVLSNLGYYLCKRFDRLKNVHDINQAISYQQQAISLSAMIGASNPGWHTNLGGSFHARFNHLQDPADLNEAIQHQEMAVKGVALTDVLRPGRLNNLGTYIFSRFELDGKLEDLSASIEYLNEAVSSPHASNADKATWLGNLANAYKARFERLDQIDDLQNTIRCGSQANSLIPEGHIYRCGTLLQLGQAYDSRFERLFRPLDLILGVRTYHEAAGLLSGEPYLRFTAAMRCGRLSIIADKKFALGQYDRAMGLLPSVVWLGTTVQRRYKDLPSIGSAVTEAAAMAIKFQEYELGLEWLEQGRSIVWQQTLNLRTPFDELGEVDPTLAARLKDIAQQLGGMAAETSSSFDDPHKASISEKATQQHRRLAEEWEQRLGQARRLPGFNSFMRPRKATELFPAARFGAVVIINIHNLGCDALALRPDAKDVMHISLPNFTHQKAIALHMNLVHSLQRKSVRERGVQVGKAAPVDMLGGILSQLWWDVVQPILKSLGYMRNSVEEELPHITWCTTGPLVFLPLHAAGCYSKPDARVYNYAVSSYTPTLSALLASSRSTHEFQGILAVGQTSTLGLQPLPGTTQELGSIKEQARGVRYTQLDEQNATVNNVLDAIEKHSWVHFACHASQNASDPTASAFHLHNGPLNLTTIMQKSFKHAGLAFLSACQTAKGDTDLPEESVHLAAGMLMAGFPAVIATMWSIRDEDAPLVAGEVYTKLLEGGKPDSRRAAKALHMAVERLREKVGEKEFVSWVPYVHLGI
ncbi:TPR-like protein [Ceratobasidium sp. AG-I]|nr:TPR-like protein [Ceratobasidium sp. AG-I]